MGEEDGGDSQRGQDQQENGGIDNFNLVLLKLTERVNKLQGMIREKRIQYNVFSNTTGPAPHKSRPVPDFSRMTSNFNGTHSPRSLFTNLKHPKTVEELQKVVNTNTELKSTYGNLTNALNISQRAFALNQALELAANGIIQLDEEEIAHVKGLLSDQRDLYLRVINTEQERLEKEIELREGGNRLTSQYTKLLEMFPDLCETNSGEENEEEEEQTAEEGNGIAASRGIVQKKRETLKKEEQRVDQIRFLIQKCIMGTPMERFDEETQKSHSDMLLKCGKSVEELRRGE